jgi:hypothetical protein
MIEDVPVALLYMQLGADGAFACSISCVPTVAVLRFFHEPGFMVGAVVCHTRGGAPGHT